MDIQIGSNAIYTTNAPTLSYKVVVGGVAIYRGRAICAPNGKITVNVSKIVEDWLNSDEFPKMVVNPQTYQENNGYVVAYLYRINNDETQYLLGTYGFLRSYDEDWQAGVYDSRQEVWTGQSITMSNPVNGRMDPRMQFLYTVYRATSGGTIGWGIVPKFRIVPNPVIASPDGGAYSLMIESNVPFTATTEDGWITLSGSAPNYSVEVSFNDENERTGGIKLTYLDENDVQQTLIVPVIQAGAEITVIPELINFPVDGAESRFTVISNVEVTPTTNVDWITFEPIRTGDGFVTYKIVAAPNRESSSGRTGYISVRGAVGLVVTQEAFAISVSIDTTEYSWAGDEGNLYVTANGRYEITTDVDWIRITPNEGGSGTTRFTVIVDENDTIYERTGHIIIEGNVITITQQRQSFIGITPLTWTAAATGGSQTFQISDRFEHSWKITGLGNFTASQTEGTGNTEVEISIGAATSTSSYTAAPKLVDMTTGEEIQFVLKRKAPVITVTPSTINAAASGGTYTFTVYSEVDYTLNDDSDWITLSASGGTAGTTEFTATVNVNATMSEKTGHIKVFNANKITVIQEASQIAVSPTSINAAALGSGYTITVTSNTLYDITVDADWITVPSSGGTGVTEITVIVDDNQVPSARTATIMIGFIPVTVSQEALFVTLSTESGTTYPDAPSRTVLSITSNGRYPVYTEYDWLEVDTPSGTSGTTVITISNNESSTKEWEYLRNATVHIGYQTFTLCQQNGEDFLKYLTFTVTSGGTITWAAVGSYGSQQIYYSKNGGNWASLYNGYGTPSINVEAGDMLRFKAQYEGGTNKTLSGYSKFGGTAKVEVSGNILSMAYMDDFPGARAVPVQNYWIGLFTNLNISSTYGFVLPSNVPAAEQDAYKYLKSTTVIDAYNSHIRYTPTIQEADDYLTFEILSSGTIAWGDKSYAYSKNGQSWVRPSEGYVSVSAGDKVRMTAGWNDSSEWQRINSLRSFSGSTASFNLSGNVASLIFHTGFANEHLYGHSTFNGLFAGTKVVDASALKVPMIFTHQGYLKEMFSGCTMLTAMPDLTICEHIPVPSIYCEQPEGTYEEMFSGCTTLAVADKLPIFKDSSNVGDIALRNMFNGCSLLSSIKDVSNVTTASIYGDWVYGVASAGTFEKRASVTSWSSGTSGVPYNWSVVDIKQPATVEDNIIIFNYTGGTGSISIIDSDEAGWNITGADEWVTLSSQSGTGSTNVSVTVASASTADDRYNDIKLHSGGKTWNVQIYQYRIPVASVTPTSLKFGASQQTMQLSVYDSANIGWAVSGMPEWLTVSVSAGTGTTTVSVTASSNVEGSDRTATIVFSSMGSMTEISVEQGSGYGGDYFTIEVISGGTLGLSRNEYRDIYISKNGADWSLLGGNALNVSSGDIVKYKSSGAFYFSGSTATYNVRGNIMSVLYGDDFESQTAITTNKLQKFFYKEKVVSAEQLVMPAQSLSEDCYKYMFSGCTMLQIAPTLPAEEVYYGSYDYMFRGCSSLRYIKCLCERFNEPLGWVYGVAANGTFVKKSGVSWTTGQNGIPSGWTVQEE